MKKIVIFDLDGTLLNTLADLTESLNLTLRKYNFPEKTIEQVRNFVGNGVEKLIERAIPKGKNNSKYDECINLFKSVYSKNMYNKTAPYDGILPMLKTIKSQGLKVAVISNKFDHAVKELCNKYFEKLVDFSAGENEAQGVKKKPAPDTVLKVLDNFSIDKPYAVYVGDSEVDIQTAINSEIDCISVSWGFKSRVFLSENDAKIIIDKPDEIFRYL